MWRRWPQLPDLVIPGRHDSGEPGIYRAAGMLGEMDSGLALMRAPERQLHYTETA